MACELGSDARFSVRAANVTYDIPALDRCGISLQYMRTNAHLIILHDALQLLLASGGVQTVGLAITVVVQRVVGHDVRHFLRLIFNHGAKSQHRIDGCCHQNE